MTNVELSSYTENMWFVKPVYAVNVCDLWTFCQGSTNFTSLGGIVSFFLPKALLVGAIIFFFLIVFAGVGMISGAGNSDPHAKEQSKLFLTSALIGLLLMFGAYWVLQLINYIIGGSLDGLIR